MRMQMVARRTYGSARKRRTKKGTDLHKKGIKTDPSCTAQVHDSFVTDDTVTVLIIDDEHQIRRLVRNALNDNPGFLRAGLDDTAPSPHLRVLEAESGQNGIDLAAAEDPAIVILDLGLPDMEGIAVCREMRR